MNVPDRYSPLETMEKLLPILSEGLGLTNEDLLQIAAQEMAPETLERSPLERMQDAYHLLEQQCIAQHDKV